MNLIVLTYFTKKVVRACTWFALNLLFNQRGLSKVAERTFEKILQDDKTTFTPTSSKSKNHPSD